MLRMFAVITLFFEVMQHNRWELFSRPLTFSHLSVTLFKELLQFRDVTNRKKNRSLGGGKRISKKKVSTRVMIKKTVRGGKIDFHFRSKEKTFIDLPKIQPNPLLS